ncbi:nucleotidyltransferase family protein [Pseudoalteromonas sp. CR1]|uniref:nucleotidyltransferase family protein n=1 Tax=Pseudoalteromonas sp. CR1 TaxID=2861964 RepID=UPI001C5CFF70|nr:nucleotidyltransferase family protein [Pseudoalteromonas sp. CR1]MBW4965782.1 nucleotidyltransferase family protein [Pseudoalteromonas sp. CR1]
MRIAKVLLAAGQSSRFNGCKLIANVGNNKSMIARAVEVLQQLDASPVYIVSGAWHSEITQALKHCNNIEIIHNLHWHQGLGKSIALAVNHLKHSGDWDGILFTLADQVELETCDIQLLVTQFQKTPTRWCANYGKRLGVPAIFPHDDFDLLTTLTTDKGAQHLLRSSGDIVNSILINQAGTDIDTVEQLKRYASKIGT